MSQTIKIGGREFNLDPLPINVVEQIAAIIDEPVPESLAGMVKRVTRILATGLRSIDQSLSEENVFALRASFPEVDAAAGVVLQVAGFRQGEAVPVANSETGSASSKAPLPPAADTDPPNSIE